MANASGLIASPVSPAAVLGATISNFLFTGSLTPTLATPAFRTGSTGTYANSSIPSTVSIPLSSSIVVGDCILLCVKFNTTQVPSLPTGFTLLNQIQDPSSTDQWTYYKIAQVGDPGSTLSWTHGMSAISMSAVTLSYSGVNPAVPVSVAYTTSSPTTSMGAPMVTTPVASTVVEVFGEYASGSTVTLTGPTNQRVTISTSSTAILVSDQTQGAAGSTGSQSCSTTVSGYWTAVTLVLNGAASGGTAPSGGWTLVDTFGTSSYYYVVFESPSASNNAGVNWYFVQYFYLLNTQTTWFGYACETYTPSNHTYNAATINSSSGTPPYTPGSGTTPPYAQVAGTPNVISNNYASLFNVAVTVGTGSNNILIAANRDGLFFSLVAGGTFAGACYFGTGTTLITNPSLTDILVLDAIWYPGTGTQPAGSPTREPGWTSSQIYWGYYQLSPFYPLMGNSAQQTASLGTVNGATGDLFLSANMPLAARVLFYRFQGNGSQGIIRGLLPAWIQFAQQTGCAWGDTTTETTDTLIYAGAPSSQYANWLWIDSSTA